MDYKELGLILMKWSLRNEEWDMVHYLYTTYHIGIPNQILYAFPHKNKYNSITNALESHLTLSSTIPKLQDLLLLFKESRWERLPEWNNLYGYRY